RWDRYLRGNKKAVTPEEIAGHQEFVSAGCAACHSGAYLGGNGYQKLGARKAWPDTKDAGRAEVTKSAADRQVFKVPSLRNIAMTGPYFHDGRVVTLEEAIRLMGEHQLNKNLSDAQVRSIATWLKSLTGTLPAKLIAPPKLPK
ncbi:MAG: c-type cytochrome, partial [Bryobacterales bacterium]|nr:c-type cytochrome [Bryobacterales bacterium]